MRAGVSQPCEADFPKIQNVVATIKMVRHDITLQNPKIKPFDLQEIAQKCRNTQYNPKRFPAVFMRIKDPKATGLIYSSGNMTIVGTRSTTESQIAAEKIFKTIKKELELIDSVCEFEQKRVQVRNIVASCKLGYAVSLDKINDDKDHGTFCTFDDNFPGLIYRYMLNKNQQKKGNNNIIALVFSSGKMVFTGAKSQEDIQKAYDHIRPQFTAFIKKDSLQPPKSNNHNSLSSSSSKHPKAQQLTSIQATVSSTVSATTSPVSPKIFRNNKTAEANAIVQAESGDRQQQLSSLNQIYQPQIGSCSFANIGRMNTSQTQTFNNNNSIKQVYRTESIQDTSFASIDTSFNSINNISLLNSTLDTPPVLYQLHSQFNQSSNYQLPQYKNHIHTNQLINPFHLEVGTQMKNSASRRDRVTGSVVFQ